VLLACGGCITDQSASSSGPQATITISRPGGGEYTATVASVELNGSHIVNLTHGRSYTGPVSPGPAVLKVSAWSASPETPWLAPFAATRNQASAGSASYRFNVEPGKSYSFVISPREVSPTAGGALRDGPFQIVTTQ
jgi:hypothetical protein